MRDKYARCEIAISLAHSASRDVFQYFVRNRILGQSQKAFSPRLISIWGIYEWHCSVDQRVCTSSQLNLVEISSDNPHQTVERRGNWAEERSRDEKRKGKREISFPPIHLCPHLSSPLPLPPTSALPSPPPTSALPSPPPHLSSPIPVCRRWISEYESNRFVIRMIPKIHGTTQLFRKQVNFFAKGRAPNNLVPRAFSGFPPLQKALVTRLGTEVGPQKFLARILFPVPSSDHVMTTNVAEQICKVAYSRLNIPGHQDVEKFPRGATAWPLVLEPQQLQVSVRNF